MVYRVCVEKKPGLAPECASLLSDCRSFLDLKGLESVRIWNRYDVEGIDEALFAYATNTVFSEPQLDLTSGEIDASGAAAVFDDYIEIMATCIIGTSAIDTSCRTSCVDVCIYVFRSI